MRARNRLITASTILLVILQTAANSQDFSGRTSRARLTRCTPAGITPGMWIKLEGYDLDAFGSKVKVLFLQDQNSYEGSPVGGSRESNVEPALEEVSLAVPADLKPGKCEIVVETNGVSSAPLEVEVVDFVAPAVISNLRPQTAQPGALIWITAVGICESDEIEVKDSTGGIHLARPRPTSEGTGAAFELPENVAAGEAMFTVLETRSGLNKRSNALSLRVVVDPAPIIFYLHVRSLAPGQWIDAPVENRVLCQRADMIEVAFIQKEPLIVPVQPFPRSTNSALLHLQVPISLSPGPVKIVTRTWINNRASDWSQPVELEMLDHAAAPYIWGIYVWTPKGAEQSIDFTAPGNHLIKARSGDTLVLSGSFLIDSVASLRASLEADGQIVEMPLREGDNRFFVTLTIPPMPRPGEWRIVITNTESDVSAQAPVAIVIE